MCSLFTLYTTPLDSFIGLATSTSCALGLHCVLNILVRSSVAVAPSSAAEYSLSKKEVFRTHLRMILSLRSICHLSSLLRASFSASSMTSFEKMSMVAVSDSEFMSKPTPSKKVLR